MFDLVSTETVIKRISMGVVWFSQTSGFGFVWVAVFGLLCLGFSLVCGFCFCPFIVGGQNKLQKHRLFSRLCLQICVGLVLFVLIWLLMTSACFDCRC